MRIALDTEYNHLENPTSIHCVCCVDIDTGEERTFRDDYAESERSSSSSFAAFAKWVASASVVIGHNIIEADWRWISYLIDDECIPADKVRDTLILSRLHHYRQQGGHSLENWGVLLDHPKIHTDITDWSRWTPQIEERCMNDARLTAKVYQLLQPMLERAGFERAISAEHALGFICLDMHVNGFRFDADAARALHNELSVRVDELDRELLSAFPARARADGVFTPRLTKKGTISRTNLRWWKGSDFTVFTPNASLTRIKYEPFNPGSPSQIVERLSEAGWKPTVKTDSGESWKVNEENLATLPDTAPAAAKTLVQRLMLVSRVRKLEEWLKYCHTSIKIKKEDIEESGRAISEKLTSNGSPKSVNTIVNDIERAISKNTEENTCKNSDTINKKNGNDDIILKIHTEFPLRTLTEWLKSNKVDVHCVEEASNSLSITVTPRGMSESFSADRATRVLDGLKIAGILFSTTSRIRGKFISLGTWTHRMSHNKPNMGNISAAKSIKYKGKELSDEAIRLGGIMRGFWGCSDDSFLVGTDFDGAHLRIFAHLINDKELIEALTKGDKRLGTDAHSINQRKIGVLCTSRDISKTCVYTFLNGGGAPKFASILGCNIEEGRQSLRSFVESYPGLQWFRSHECPRLAAQGWFEGLDGRKVPCDSEHHMLAAILQNAEKVIMTHANIKWRQDLRKDGIDFRQLVMVHDEWQTEVPGSRQIADHVGRVQVASIIEVGRELGLRCPLAGNYEIGKDWRETH